MNYWLIKSEPSSYSWEQFVKDGGTMWNGVRNYAARKNLQAMKKGDHAFFYHSNDGKEIVGIAKITREHYPDPTTEDEAWVAVDLAPLKALKRAVTLAEIKGTSELNEMQLIKLSRLSVSLVTKAEYDFIVKMAGEK